jgi:hypothetical protein
VDYSYGNEQDATGIDCHRRLALDVIFYRAFEDINDLLAGMLVLGKRRSRFGALPTISIAAVSTAMNGVVFMLASFELTSMDIALSAFVGRLAFMSAGAATRRRRAVRS